MSYLIKPKLQLYCYHALTRVGVPFSHEKVIYTLAKNKVDNVPLFFVDEDNAKKELTQAGNSYNSVQITPDFIVYGKTHTYIIETKGKETAKFKIKWKLLRMHLSAIKGQDYMMFLPKHKNNIDKIIDVILTLEKDYIAELKELKAKTITKT